MITTIQLKRDTSIAWEVYNPVLKVGEPGYATDTKVLKIGDGVTAWNDLEPYGISEDIYNNPKLTSLAKSYLEDDANWENGSYIGAQLEDIAQGTRHYDNVYVYEFVENNTPVRYLRS